MLMQQANRNNILSGIEGGVHKLFSFLLDVFLGSDFQKRNCLKNFNSQYLSYEGPNLWQAFYKSQHYEELNMYHRC